ncbi:uncharacterized protein FYW47_003289 [Aplochiton taeniatus]
MLVTMLTAMYIMVRTAESIGLRWARQPEPLPYIASQPLPWQIHFVSHSRKTSKSDDFEGHRRNSIGVYRKNKSALAVVSASLAIPCLLSCSDSSSSTGNGHAPADPRPLSPVEAEKAAARIQNQYRKYQQKKQKDGK